MTTALNGTKIKHKPHIAHKGWLLFFQIVFGLYSLTLIFPLLWLLYNAVKTKQEFFLAPWALPKSPFKNIANFGTAFTEFNLGKMFLHTVILTVVSPLLSLFFHCCTAYAYARHRFKLRGVLYMLMIAPMVVNIAGTLPTMYKLICDIGVYDNLFMLMVVTHVGGTGFNFLLLGSIFTNISGSYKEAAMIDGAGHWRIFLTIYLPQASNILLSLYILAAIGVWNDYMTPYLYLPSYPTLATGIYNLQAQVSSGGSVYSDDWPKLFAAMLLSILPVLVLFVVFQKRIMTMAAGGGIKE